MSLLRTRFLPAALLLAAVLAAFGCSNGGTDPDPPPTFTQSEADDVAQMVGATVSSNLGGWMVEIARSLNKRQTAGDTTEIFVQGAITHDLSFIYRARLGGTSAVWDTSVVSVDVHDVGVGNYNEVALKGPYHHVSDLSIFSANEDTMYFNALAIDTSLFTVKSFTGGDTVYYHMENFFDYDEARLLATQTAANPWPIDGTVSWLIDATKLASASLATAQRNILVEAVVTFNNSAVVPLTVFEDLTDPRTVFNFTLNLQTGVVARAP